MNSQAKYASGCSAANRTSTRSSISAKWAATGLHTEAVSPTEILRLVENRVQPFGTKLVLDEDGQAALAAHVHKTIIQAVPPTLRDDPEWAEIAKQVVQANIAKPEEGIERRGG